MKKRLTAKEIKSQFPQEAVFTPNFNYLWERISIELSSLNLEKNILERVKKSVGDLPSVLEPLWKEKATLQTVAQARILFFEHSLAIQLPRKLRDSKSLLSKMSQSNPDINSKRKLQTDCQFWFKEQIVMHAQIVAGKEAQTVLISIPENIKAAFFSGQITIAQLLILQPELFYKLPGML
ncbi:MAG: hypothetical protein BroJett025_03900 [Patescibacteria group bacterium]|nr:MAG: hypothetical protein BroJett025_03900 [Patescibacteria group bacterium]